MAGDGVSDGAFQPLHIAQQRAELVGAEPLDRVLVRLETVDRVRDPLQGYELPCALVVNRCLLIDLCGVRKPIQRRRRHIKGQKRSHRAMDEGHMSFGAPPITIRSAVAQAAPLAHVEVAALAPEPCFAAAVATAALGVTPSRREALVIAVGRHLREAMNPPRTLAAQVPACCCAQLTCGLRLYQALRGAQGRTPQCCTSMPLNMTMLVHP